MPWNPAGSLKASPIGAAGGDLQGSYPNPTLRLGAVGGYATARLRRYRLTDMTIPNNVWTQPSLGSGGSGSNGSDGVAAFSATATVYTVLVAGVFLIQVNAPFAASTGGRRAFLVNLNDASATPGPGDASVILSDNRAPVGASVSTTLGASTTRLLAANDALRLWVNQTSGADLALQAATYGGVEFVLTRISA